MATTHLFVELLVIGFGAILWFILIVASALGYDLSQFDKNSISLGTMLPILSLVYTLGILTDRVADWIFDKIFGKTLLYKVYPRQSESEAPANSSPNKTYTFHEDRRLLVVEAPRLWQFLEYGRSRLRICRGWALNAVLIAVSLNAYFLASSDALPLSTTRILLLNSIFAVFLAVACRSWWKLSLEEYKKTKRQAHWVRHHKEENKVQEIQLSGSLDMGGRN